MRPHRPAVSLILLGAAVITTSCSDSIGPESRADRITLTASSTELEVGSTVSLAATVLNATGGVVASRQISWESMNPEIASVSTAGVVTGIRAGGARIRATAGTATTTISLTVHPPACTTASASGSLTVGQSVSGALAATDCRLFHGAVADGWTLTLSQTADIRIAMASSLHDAALFITDLNLNVLDYGDRDASGVASIVGQFPAGSYLVWTTTWSGSSAGAYTLSVGTVTLCSRASVTGSVAVDETVSGTLSQDSCLLPHGLPGMAWRFQTTSHVTVRAVMDVAGFEGLLVATTMDMEPVAFGAGAGPGSTVELVHGFPPGEYLLWVTSTSGGMGAFTLRLSEARLEGCTPTSDVAIGSTVSGTLVPGGCALPDGRLTETWRFTLSEAANLRLDMTSSQLDSYLIITDEQGRILAVDDDGGAGVNARVVQAFAAGTYIAWATTFAPGQGGAYQLGIQVASAGSTIGERAGGARAGTLKSVW